MCFRRTHRGPCPRSGQFVGSPLSLKVAHSNQGHELLRQRFSSRPGTKMREDSVSSDRDFILPLGYLLSGLESSCGLFFGLHHDRCLWCRRVYAQHSATHLGSFRTHRSLLPRSSTSDGAPQNLLKPGIQALISQLRLGSNGLVKRRIDPDDEAPRVGLFRRLVSLRAKVEIVID